jgi:hypothetical protein
MQVLKLAPQVCVQSLAVLTGAKAHAMVSERLWDPNKGRCLLHTLIIDKYVETFEKHKEV